MKPDRLCKLEKDKLIDSQEGFVDTFNWMVDFINNLKGEGDINKNKKITVDKTVSDHPIIKLGGKDSNGGGSITVKCRDTDGTWKTVDDVNTISFSTGGQTNAGFELIDGGDGNIQIRLKVYYV